MLRRNSLAGSLNSTHDLEIREKSEMTKMRKTTTHKKWENAGMKALLEQSDYKHVTDTDNVGNLPHTPEAAA